MLAILVMTGVDVKCIVIDHRSRVRREICLYNRTLCVGTQTCHGQQEYRSSKILFQCHKLLILVVLGILILKNTLLYMLIT